jgi:hypothetical protein
MGPTARTEHPRQPQSTRIHHGVQIHHSDTPPKTNPTADTDTVRPLAAESTASPRHRVAA